MVTWGLLSVLAILGLLGLRKLYIFNREFKKNLAMLRLHLLLLDVIQEAQVTLANVQCQDFVRKSRLLKIRDRLNHLLERLNSLEVLHEQTCLTYTMPPDEAIDKHLPLARETLLGCRDRLNNNIIDLDLQN